MNDFPRDTVQNKEKSTCSVHTCRTVNYRRAGFLPSQTTSRKKNEKERIADKHTRDSELARAIEKSGVVRFTSTSLAQDSNDHERISNAV